MFVNKISGIDKNENMLCIKKKATLNNKELTNFKIICFFLRWIFGILCIIDGFHNPGITDGSRWGPLLFGGLSLLFFALGPNDDKPKRKQFFTTADEIKKYAGLRDKGIITEEEFQSKKRKLLK